MRGKTRNTAHITGKSVDIMDHGFCLSYISGETTVRRALAVLMTHFSRYGLRDDTRGRVELVLAEALNNIAEHGYCPDHQGPVRVYCEPRENDIKIEIHDFCGEQAPDLWSIAHNQINPADLPEGGFGCFIIESLCSALSFKRNGAENTLSFSIVR